MFLFSCFFNVWFKKYVCDKERDYKIFASGSYLGKKRGKNDVGKKKDNLIKGGISRAQLEELTWRGRVALPLWEIGRQGL